MTKDHDVLKANQSDFMQLKVKLETDAPSMFQFTSLQNKTLSYMRSNEESVDNLWKRVVNQHNSQHSINTEIKGDINKHAAEIEKHDDKISELLKTMFKMKN